MSEGVIWENCELNCKSLTRLFKIIKPGNLTVIELGQVLLRPSYQAGSQQRFVFISSEYVFCYHVLIRLDGSISQYL